MSDIFTVSFFGHRWISNISFVKKEIRKIVKKIIAVNDCVEFLVGRNCDFDIATSKVINSCQKTSDNTVSLICVLPSPTGIYNNNNRDFYHYHYDDVEITYNSVEISSKMALQIRNADMVNRSNLCVFFVNQDEGIAWQTMKYAISQKKDIINIADFQTESDCVPSWIIW